MSEMFGAMRQVGSNPLYLRLTANAKSPSLRVVLWVASGLTVLVTLVFLLPIITMARLTVDGRISYEESQIVNGQSGPAFFVALAGYVLIPLAMLVTTVVAAVITARDAGGEEYELLQLTDLTARERTLAYVATAFYRVRVLLGLMLGLLPALPGLFVIGPIIALVFEFIICGIYGESCDSVDVAINNVAANVAFMAGGLLLAMVVVGGLLLLAAAIGVSAGLQRRRVSTAVWTSLLSILILIVMVAGLWFVGTNLSIILAPAMVWVVFVGSIALIWGLALLSLRLAQNWA